VSKFSDAAFSIIQARKVATITTRDLWAALEVAHPQLTAKTPTRKTPRTTCMRDILKDKRFNSAGGKVSLSGAKK
jgi:hypothetical protein